MVNIIDGWHELDRRDQETARLEFCAVDFYGPVVIFDLLRFNHSFMRAKPVISRTENASYSMSDLNVLKMASKEILRAYGSFTLCLPLFEVFIYSEEKVDEDIENKLLNIRLF